MSDVKEKDNEQKKLSKEILEKQIAESKRFIEYAQSQVATFQAQIQQQVGVLGFSEHLLKQFDIPSEPKEEPKKPDLEVK